jgi:hypothetical protein
MRLWLLAGTGATLGLQMFIQRKFPYPVQWNLLMAAGGYSRERGAWAQKCTPVARGDWLFSKGGIPPSMRDCGSGTSVSGMLEPCLSSPTISAPLLFPERGRK